MGWNGSINRNFDEVSEHQSRVMYEENERLANQVTALARKIHAIEEDQPHARAMPVPYNGFLHAMSAIPEGRFPEGQIYTIPVAALHEHDRVSRIKCEAVSFRMPIGKETRHVQGWMLPSNIVVVDDGNRRHIVADALELERMTRPTIIKINQDPRHER